MTPKNTPCGDADRMHVALDVSSVDRGEGATEERAGEACGCSTDRR